MNIKNPETVSNFDFPGLPLFPLDINIAPLHRLSLGKLRSDSDESRALFVSSRDLGFFYLDLTEDVEGRELLAEADAFFALAPEFFNIGRDELQKFDYKSQGSYMGYKGYGAAVVDEQGNLDANEFYNHLHLPSGTLASLHRLMETSGDQIRLVKSPPQSQSELRIALGKHTDFGSITILFNQLGGLQILPPSSRLSTGQEPEWTYVKPLRGHCIVNLGDAMVKFTNRLLRSNIHRVVAPPGSQAQFTRYSLVYFSRPEDDVLLKRLQGSNVIPELRLQDGEKEEIVSSRDWVQLQAMRLREIRPGTSIKDRQDLWNKSA